MTIQPHIAILVCDTPHGAVSVQHGDFGDNTVDLLQDTGLPLKKYIVCGPEPEQLQATYTSLAALIASGHVTGIFLTGSRSDAFARGVPWIELLDQFLQSLLEKPAVPIVGICFGHQILGKNLGCKVGRNSSQGWECGTTSIELNKEVLQLPSFRPFEGLDHLNISEYHQDIVFDLPVVKGSQIASIGSTANTSIQGFATTSGPLKILTFQGHPEFTPEILVKLIQAGYDDNELSKQEFDQFTSSTKSLENHGPLIAKVINNFYREQ